MVEQWLKEYMFSKETDPGKLAKDASEHFADKKKVHKSHGRRIDRDDARGQKIKVNDLEDSQKLQDAVLTAYHLATLAFEQGPATKTVAASTGKMWNKNLIVQPPPKPHRP